MDPSGSGVAGRVEQAADAHAAAATTSAAASPVIARIPIPEV